MPCTGSVGASLRTRGLARQGTMPGEARDIMWPSLPSNGRGRQTTVKGTPPGSTMCANSVEGETQRVATRSEQRLHLRLQSGHTIGIQEGEQESRFPLLRGETVYQATAVSSQWKLLHKDVKRSFGCHSR